LSELNCVTPKFFRLPCRRSGTCHYFPGRYNQLQLAARQEQDNGGNLLVWLLQKYDPITRLVEVLEFFEEYDSDGLMAARRYSALQFHLLERDTFIKLVDETGFEVARVYGDYNYAPFVDDSSPFMIWVLRRTA
jgi:hypothetical protein